MLAVGSLDANSKWDVHMVETFWLVMFDPWKIANAVAGSGHKWPSILTGYGLCDNTKPHRWGTVCARACAQAKRKSPVSRVKAKAELTSMELAPPRSSI